MKEQIRKLSADSQEKIGPFGEKRVKRAERYTDDREKTTEAMDSVTRLKANLTKELEVKGQIDRTTAKRVLLDLEEEVSLIVRERAAIAKDLIKLKLGILSNIPSRKLAEAYATTLTQIVARTNLYLAEGRTWERRSELIQGINLPGLLTLLSRSQTSFGVH